MANLGAIDHIDIVVANPKEMANFLISVGFTLVRETDHGGGSVEVAFPGYAANPPILELTSQDQGNGTIRPLGLRHIAVRSSDIRGSYEALKGKGYRVDEPRVIEATGRTLFNVKDPEGKSLQIVDAE